MAFNDSDMKFWRERLFHADRVWKAHGLAKGASESAMQYLRAYRNDQWEGALGDIPLKDCVTVNMVFSVTNTLMATLNARHPIVDVTAEAPAFMDNARIMEALLNHLVRSRKLKMKRELNRVLKDALLLPGGVIRHTFTPAIEHTDRQGRLLEYYDPSKPDFPGIRRVPLWDVRIDPLAETFQADGDARWCAFRTLHTREEIRKNPNLKDRKDLKPTVSIEKLDFMGEIEPLTSPDEPSLVEIWTVYDKTERKWFAISPGSDKAIREEDDWPLPWPGLPMNFLGFNEQVDDPFPVPYPMVYWQLQQERNKARTMANELVKRLRRIVIVQEDEIKEDDQDKLEDASLTEIIRSKGNPNEILGVVQAGGLPQELLLYDRQIKADVEEITGVGDFIRAQRANVESASEAQFINAGQNIQTGKNQAPFEDFVSDVIATFAVALQQVITDDFTVPIVGQEDATRLLQGESRNPFLTVGPKQIAGEFVYEIRPNSMLPRDPMEEKRNALAFTQSLTQFGEGVNLNQLILDIARAFDKDPTRYIMPPQAAAAADRELPLQQARRGGAESQGTVPPNVANLIGRGNGAA